MSYMSDIDINLQVKKVETNKGRNPKGQYSGFKIC